MASTKSRWTKDDYLFSVMETLVVILQRWYTFLGTGYIIGICVDDVAG